MFLGMRFGTRHASGGTYQRKISPENVPALVQGVKAHARCCGDWKERNRCGYHRRVPEVLWVVNPVGQPPKADATMREAEENPSTLSGRGSSDMHLLA